MTLELGKALVAVHSSSLTALSDPPDLRLR
jgi:hypothetical protein